jgi:glycerophosphoryl diester phosphodiesterase
MRPVLDSDFFTLPRPRVIAHRGASGDYPENTQAAFRGAAESGARYFELDVHMTRDGEIVVSHDPDLRRTCGVGALVADLTLAEVKRADAGWGFSPNGKDFPFRGCGMEIPALSEVFSCFSEHCYVIEVKQSVPSLVVPLLDVIERVKMRRRVLVASEHQEPLDEVRALAPGIPTSFSYFEVAGFMASLVPGAQPYQPRADALQIPPEYESWQLVTPESLTAAHRAGVEVHVWTINEVAEMRALLARGVDGILTDYPARLLELLR